MNQVKRKGMNDIPVDRVSVIFFLIPYRKYTINQFALPNFFSGGGFNFMLRVLDAPFNPAERCFVWGSGKPVSAGH